MLKLAAVLTVATTLLLFVATTSNAGTASRSRQKSFGEWTAICSYDDMLETTSCSVVSDSKATRKGLIRGDLSIVDTDLMVVVSGATPSVLGPIVKVDDNPVESGLVLLGGPSYDVNASGFRYLYLMGDSMTGAKRLRVRVPLNTGDDLEAVFDLSGYSRAKAFVDKWKAGEARP